MRSQEHYPPMQSDVTSFEVFLKPRGTPGGVTAPAFSITPAISMTTLREKLIKIGAKVVSGSRYTRFQMAEVAVPKKLFAAILERIWRFAPLRLVPG